MVCMCVGGGGKGRARGLQQHWNENPNQPSTCVCKKQSVFPPALLSPSSASCHSVTGKAGGWWWLNESKKGGTERPCRPSLQSGIRDWSWGGRTGQLCSILWRDAAER